MTLVLAADVQVVMKHVTQLSCFNGPGVSLHVRASEVGLAKGEVEKQSRSRPQETESVLSHALHHAIHFARHIVQHLLAWVPHGSILRHEGIHRA